MNKNYLGHSFRYATFGYYICDKCGGGYILWA